MRVRIAKGFLGACPLRGPKSCDFGTSVALNSVVEKSATYGAALRRDFGTPCCPASNTFPIGYRGYQRSVGYRTEIGSSKKLPSAINGRFYLPGTPEPGASL